MLSDRPEYGRTFNSVMWIVCSLAAIQLIAVAWAILRKAPVPAREETPVAMRSAFPIDQRGGEGVEVPAPLQPAPNVPSPSESNMPADGAAEIPPVGAEAGGAANTAFNDSAFQIPDTSAGANRSFGFSGAESKINREVPGVLPQPAFHGPAGAQPTLSDDLAAAALSAPPIEGAILERLVSAGEEHRASGNMQGALRDLKDAESALPEHPRVLGGLAATYRQMGLDAKADAYWEKLLQLGPVRAGDYYAIAERLLKGEEVPSEGSAASIMRLGKVIVEEAPKLGEVQKVSLRVPIEADTSANPVGNDMSLIVYFFDLVDGEKIEPSTADTSELYPTEPYDWKIDGREEIVVNYTQPEFTEEQIRELGHRSYYGYAIELYYRDQLQDKKVVPSEITLLQYPGMSGGQSAQPSSPGPENGLFPE